MTDLQFTHPLLTLNSLFLVVLCRGFSVTSAITPSGCRGAFSRAKDFMRRMELADTWILADVRLLGHEPIMNGESETIRHLT